MSTNRYMLLRDIVHPMGSVKAGTESIYHDGFYIFPYEGRSYNDDGNGWLGSAFMCSDISGMPEWFSLIEDEPKENEFQWTDELVLAFASNMHNNIMNVMPPWGTGITFSNEEMLKDFKYIETQKSSHQPKQESGAFQFNDGKLELPADSPLVEALRGAHKSPAPMFYEHNPKQENKEWDIVAFIMDDGRQILKEPYHTMYRIGHGLNKGLIGESTCLEKYKIHSVKRLSDGEVFTVGDKIEYREGDAKNWDGRKWEGNIKSIRVLDKEVEFAITDMDHEIAHKFIKNIRHKNISKDNSRIEVTFLSEFAEENGKQRRYEFWVTREIPVGMFDGLKKVMESYLNKEPYDAKSALEKYITEVKGLNLKYKYYTQQ